MTEKIVFDENRICESEIVCTGLLYWKEDKKKSPIRKGGFGDYAVFSLLQQKKKVKGKRTAYIPIRAFGKAFDQVKDIPLLSFVRITGSVDNIKGFHIKAKTVDILETGKGASMANAKKTFRDIEGDYLSESLEDKIKRRMSEIPGMREKSINEIFLDKEDIKQRARKNLIDIALIKERDYEIKERKKEIYISPPAEVDKKISEKKRSRAKMMMKRKKSKKQTS